MKSKLLPVLALTVSLGACAQGPGYYGNGGYGGGYGNGGYGAGNPGYLHERYQFRFRARVVAVGEIHSCRDAERYCGSVRRRL